MVHNKLLLSISCFLLAVSVNACAQGKKSAAQKSAGKHSTVVAAAKQVVLPGAPGMEPSTNHMFVIVWKSSTPPESFYWRGEDGWMPCNVAKSGKSNTADRNFPYNRAPIQLDRIKQGDTLLLTPARRSKEVVPASIPASVTNTLYFKTAKTSWLGLAINNIQELPKEIRQ